MTSLSALLLSSVLATDPAPTVAEVNAPEQIAVDEEPTTAVFLAPLTIVSGAAFAPASQSHPIVYVSGGANFTANELEWSIDLAVMQRDPKVGALAVGPPGPPSIERLGFVGGWLALGPMFHTNARALHGFFLNPRMTVGVFFAGRDAMILNALVGADVGYQFTLGRFYFAFVLGASVGVGWGDNDIWSGPMLGTNSSLFAPTLGPALGLNLQVFRIGYTF